VAIQFPNNPGIGSVFTDTDAGFSYEWTGVVWKSFTPAATSNVKELDDISSGFDNSTTTFNLTISGAAYQPRSAAMLQISLGGVIQEPGTDYTVSGTTITFTTAPNAGLDFFGVVRGTAVAIDYANDGNVQTKQEFTATEGQTSFTITGGYRAGYIDVFRNGVRLGSDDFTDTSGTAIVLTVAAQADDLIEVVKYNVASLVVSEGQLVNLNVSGISTLGVVTSVTSISSGVYYGDGSALTGIDATALKDSGGNVKAQANPGGVVITGVATATTFKGDLTGDVTGNATGLSGTPNITVGSVTAASGAFSGNVSVGGTLTYQDVSHIDAVGIITAQQGIQVLANGVDVTGIGTFEDRLTYDGSLGQAGGGTVTYAVTVATKDSTHRYNGSGSSNGYVIDNLQAPVITLTPGRTYRFTNDNTGSHPLKFYYDANKTTLYSTGVTFDDAYTEITVSDTTPAVLHYQCTNHSLMGNSVITQSNPIVGAGITLNALGGGVHVTGIVTATSFSGSGENLTNLPASGDSNDITASLFI
tara:strand:- start:798 stop:2387 length:1590 start_codon:yes stop_codon:yes gene_type:complete